MVLTGAGSRTGPRPWAGWKPATAIITLGANDDHHFRALRELMGKPDWLEDDRWDDRVFRANHLMEIAPKLDAWMKQQKKNEIYHKLAKAGIPVGPINSAEEVMNSEQYKVRGYFTEVEHPVAGKYQYAGWPYRMSASPPGVSRPAPLLGQHNEEIRMEIIDRDGRRVCEIRPGTSRSQTPSAGNAGP